MSNYKENQELCNAANQIQKILDKGYEIKKWINSQNKDALFLCKKGDKENLTKKIRMMLELSNSQRAEMGKLGRKKMEREFDKNDVVSKTIETILGKS